MTLEGHVKNGAIVLEPPTQLPEGTRDPHTPIFDQKGTLFFTAQGANVVGRLDPKTGDVKVVTSPTPRSKSIPCASAGVARSAKNSAILIMAGSCRKTGWRLPLHAPCRSQVPVLIDVLSRCRALRSIDHRLRRFEGCTRGGSPSRFS